MGVKLARVATLVVALALLMSSASRSLAGPSPSMAAVEPASPPIFDEPDQPNGPALPAADVVRLFWHDGVGGPPALAGKKSVRPTELGLSAEAAQDAKQVAQSFLRVLGPELQTAQAGVEWKPIRGEVDDQSINHVFLQQLYNGIPVFAGQVAVHVKDGAVVGANGPYAPAIAVVTEPALTVEDAQKSLAHTYNLTSPVQSSELIIYNPALLDAGSSANHLAYKLVIGNEDAFDGVTALVDAESGKLLLSYSNVPEGKDRSIWEWKNRDRKLKWPCRSETFSWYPSDDCLSVFNFSGDTYDYFSGTHGRDSFDGQGATMSAWAGRDNFDNAVWGGISAIFGTGWAVKDIVAHEWTHAVTQYSANLIYQGQSGALNEAFSDIFAAMIDRDDWTIGEDRTGDTLRDMSDPTAYEDPDKTSSWRYYCGTTWDNGGVHRNSGVLNYAAYLIADGGSFNGRNITGIGRDRTERIFYRALTSYLTNGSAYVDAYNALVASAADLYPLDLDTYNTVVAAGQATEMNLPICGATSGSMDAFEADNTYSQAKNITVNGDSQRHTSHVAGDEDWVKFTVETNYQYTIETLNLGNNGDTFAALFDTNGASMIAFDDDGGGNWASRIVWTPLMAGTYYVRVTHASRSAFGGDTNYDLRITRVYAPFSVDSYEEDDGPTQAKDFTPGGAVQSHNFHKGGDRDWVKFTAYSRTWYTIRTQNLGPRADTILRLYSANGVLLRQNDDYAGGQGGASRLSFRTPLSQSPLTYYVRVANYDWSTYGAGASYDLSISYTVQMQSDAYEPDDSPDQAAAIATTGAIQSHLLEDATDVDWLRFTATSGVRYTAETLNLEGVDVPVLDLYGTDGATLLATNSSGGILGSRLAWTPTASGTYYVKLRSADSGALGAGGSYDVRIDSADCGDGDAYETDDTFGQAKSITPTIQTHNFLCDGDVDWVKFTAVASTTYTIDTLNLGADADTVLELYGADGATLITSSDDDGAGLASRIVWFATGSGTYYVKVRNVAGTDGPGTSYDLRLTSATCSSGGDAYELDNTQATAKTIAVDGTVQPHSFSCAGDLDWVKFAAVVGMDYVIETTNLSSGNDTVLTLYDTDGGTMVVENDDSGEEKSSRIVWEAPASGTYYVKVRHFSGSVYGATVTYDLRVTASGTSGAPDAYEKDDSRATATPITTTVQAHNFDAIGDVDWVTTTTLLGFTYVAETFNLGSRSDTIMQLYGPTSTTPIWTDNDGGGGVSSRILWTAPTEGPYFIGVSHAYSTTMYGANTSYDLRVTRLGPSTNDGYEPDNYYTQAYTITVNGYPQAHNFHSPEGVNSRADVDWVKFSAAAGALYHIRTLNLGPRSDTVLYLYDTNGTTQLATDDDRGGGRASRITWIAPGNGYYYVKVAHHDPSAYGLDTRYDLQVVGSVAINGRDAYEPDDTLSLAKVIFTNGVTQTHNFHYWGDLDWVKFTATAGASYTMQAFNRGAKSDVVLSLYATNGATLLAAARANQYVQEIVWTAPADGTYYVLANNRTGDYGSDTNYELNVTAAACGSGDIYEPDNTSTQAGMYELGGEVHAHTFGCAGDNDWAYFSARGGNRYNLRTIDLGPTSDTYLYLYGPDGTSVIAEDDDSGGGLASSIAWTAPVTGTYYVRARHASNTTFGPSTYYSLQISTIGTAGPDFYETDGAYWQAKNIDVVGTAQMHNFHAAFDYDWVKFIAISGTTYIVETFNLGPSSDTVLSLERSTGQQVPPYTAVIASDDDSGDGLASRITWRATFNGTVYTKVRNRSYYAYGAETTYYLRVTTATGLAAPAATAQLTAGSARVGDELEATVYLPQPASAIEVEAFAKSSYLRFVDATPLSTQGRAVATAALADAGQWEVTAAEDGRVNVRYSGKEPWDGTRAYPALKLRWQILARPTTGKVAILLQLTTLDQNGQPAIESAKLAAVVEASNPKISEVSPTSLSGDGGSVVSLRGANFVAASKVYLHASGVDYQLNDVTFIDSGLVWASVPAGTKGGTYKVRLVNPDGSSVEYADQVTVTATPGEFRVYVPLVAKSYSGGW